MRGNYKDNGKLDFCKNENELLKRKIVLLKGTLI